MSPARPDSTTVSAPSVPRARPAPGRGDRPVTGRRLEGTDRPAGDADAPDGGRRPQIILVAHVLDPAGTGTGPRPGDGLSRDVFGQAVVDVHEVSEAFGGETIAVLGNRVVVAFPADEAADAVTAAVEIQRDATRSDAASKWACAVCLVTGEVVEHPAIERLGLQPVGPIVDRALRLSAVAGPGAVVVDERTAMPAQRKAAPSPGRADDADAIVAPPAWTLGETRLLLDQDDEPIACYEIVFERNTPARAARVAVSTSAGSRTSGRGARPASGRARARNGAPGGRPEPTPAPSAANLRRRPWSEGRVFCWFSDRGRGVITSTTGQEFYVDRRFLAVGSELAAGDRVFFVPRDPVARGRNPVAGAVLGDGARIEVRIERPSEDGAALAVVSDSNGTDQVLPLDVSSVGPVATGEWLLVRIAGREGGPVGDPT